MTETPDTTTVDSSVAKDLTKDLAYTVATTAASVGVAVVILAATGAVIQWREKRQAKKAAKPEEK